MYFITKFITTIKSTCVQLMSYIKKIYIKRFVHIKAHFTQDTYICECVAYLKLENINSLHS